MENQAVSLEVALEELREFVKLFTRRTETDEVLQEKYPDVLQALQEGNMVLGEEGQVGVDLIPTHKLFVSVKNEEGVVTLDSVSFRTRFTPSEQRSAAVGIDLKKNPLLYAHKCIAHIIKQPIAMLDKFHPQDYKAIEQLTTLFM